MRGVPQVGFSAIIRKISSRTSVDSFFLPTGFLAFEIQLQYRRNPARCRRTTVSGLTSTRDCFQASQKRRANTQKILSTAPIRAGDACASALPTVAGERDFPGAGFDAIESSGGAGPTLIRRSDT